MGASRTTGPQRPREYSAIPPRAARGWYALGRSIIRRLQAPFVVTWEFAAFVWKVFPEAWNHFQFRSFWGEHVFSSGACFVIDSYGDVRLRGGLRNAEGHAGMELPEQVIGSDLVDGALSPQAAGMLTALFLRNTGKLLRIATDTEIGTGTDGTLICYGTSDSNFKTFDIEVSSGNDLCQFFFSASGQRAFRIAGHVYSMERRNGTVYDRAILLRLASRQNPGHCHVICAGLSEWGSLAAVRYLTENWKTLHKRFDGFGRRRNFCVLLEVACGELENARELASAVWWEPRARHSSEVPDLVTGP